MPYKSAMKLFLYSRSLCGVQSCKIPGINTGVFQHGLRNPFLSLAIYQCLLHEHSMQQNRNTNLDAQIFIYFVFKLCIFSCSVKEHKVTMQSLVAFFS